VGEATSEQQAMRDLSSEGPNGHPSTLTEDVTPIGEVPPLGEERLPPGEGPSRTDSS
jgi:hypothetical protein